MENKNTDTEIKEYREQFLQILKDLSTLQKNFEGINELSLHEPSQDDINRLIVQGNQFSKIIFITIKNSLSPETFESLLKIKITRIRNCSFCGTTFLFVSNTSDIKPNCLEYNVIPGLYETIFSGSCYIGPNTLIKNSVISNTYISEQSAIINSVISCSDDLLCMNTIEVGPESSGRTIVVYPGMKYQACVYQAFTQQIPSYEDYSDVLDFSYIGKECSIVNCSYIAKAVISDRHNIIASSLTSFIGLNLKDSANVIQSSQLDHVIIHSECHIMSNASLKNVMMFENSSVSESARVHDAVVGPDNSIAGGECHHSLVGSFTGFHHQSLLIACLWPYGRGNIAYGAKIGSNHTGRVNDQECWMGEGVFVGLDVTIRYPFNCISSPYSIIATGTTCQSQKISFPFSLIMDYDSNRSRVNIEGNAVGISSVYNTLKPGWMLYGNSYYIQRSAMKFSSRRNSQYHRTDYDMIRPYTINLMIAASMQLSNDIVTSESVPLPTEGRVLQYSQCLVSFQDANKGLKAYKFFITRYCLEIVDIIIEKGRIIQDPSYDCDMIQCDIRLPDQHDSPVVTSLSGDVQLSYDLNEEFYLSQRILHQLQLSQIYLAVEFIIENLNDSGSDSSSTKGLRLKKILIQKSQFEQICDKAIQFEKEYLELVIKSREKDNRGEEIIPDYSTINPFARDQSDVVTAFAKNKCNNLEWRVKNSSLCPN